MKINFSVVDSRNSLAIDDIYFEEVSVFGLEFQGDTVKLKLEAEVPATVFGLSASLAKQTESMKRGN